MQAASRREVPVRHVPAIGKMAERDLGWDEEVSGGVSPSGYELEVLGEAGHVVNAHDRPRFEQVFTRPDKLSRQGVAARLPQRPGPA